MLRHAAKSPNFASVLKGYRRGISVQVVDILPRDQCPEHFCQSLLHGSPEAKKAGDIEILQHSRLVARGKYVHGFEGQKHQLSVAAHTNL